VALTFAKPLGRLHPMKHAPTTEQQAIIDAFGVVKGWTSEGLAIYQNIVIEAGAGTGKTSTLVLLGDEAKVQGRTGVYVAYNKSVAEDAKTRFADSVQPMTAHSMAYRAMLDMPNGKALLNKLRTTSRVSPVDASKLMGIPFKGFETEDGSLAGYKVAGLVMATIQNFCNSASVDITERHVPKVDGMEDYQDALNAFVLRYARPAWGDLNLTTGKLKFQHDHYLKIWALTAPRIDADFILYDEAQDANPCMAGVIQDQTIYNTQIVMVGDQAQAIYGWRGAVDAMTRFDADARLVLSQSFRFGQAVADQANVLLTYLNAPLRLSGFDKVPSTVEPLSEFDAILCRTNAEVIAQAIMALDAGLKPAIVGGTSEIEKFTKAAAQLQGGKQTTHPDLVAFKSWGEVQEYAQEDEGRDLRVMVNLIDMHGTAAIMDICSTTVDEKDADVIVSTAHKAKGREWNRVKIAGDFRKPDTENGGTLSRPDAMLLYVTITRAKLILDMTAVMWIIEVV
jgi:superfamily I DNA/RNA helicase